ncbi:collagen alpha-1(III) chain-like [Oncorhynchus keta]|uniref:collagen alpha-1(III) chain-like n=1 Tax=Oncorhynchus keta TaxID=8018 RepID=UPI00227AE809|nr:collagen alpha-1(III) chain-like [Oncorhynchus keta]
MAVGQRQVQLHPTSLGLWDGSGPKTSPTTSYLPGPVGWQWAKDKSNYILPPWACGMAMGQRQQVHLHPTSLGLWDGSGPKTSPTTSYLPGLWNGSGPKPSPTTSYLPGPVGWQWAKDKSNYILPPGPVGWQWAKEDKSTYILPPWACGMAVGQRQVQLHPTSLGLWDGSGPKTSPPTSYLPGPVGWQWAKDKSNYILPPWACGMAVGQRQVQLHPTSLGLWDGSGPKTSPPTSYLPGPVGWQWAKDKSTYILPPWACGMAMGQRQVQLHPTSLGLWDGSGPKTSPPTSYLPGPVGWQWAKAKSNYILPPGPVEWQWAKDKSTYILPPWACGVAVGQRQVQLHPTSLDLWDGNGPKTSPTTSYLPGPVGWQWAKDKSNYILPPWACGMAVGQRQVHLHPTSLGLWDGSGPKTNPPTSYLPGPVGWQWAKDKSTYILPPWACGMAVGQRQVQLHPTSLGLWDGSGPKTSPPTSYLPGPVGWQWAKDKSTYILPPWACGMAVGQRQVQLHPTSPGLWNGSGPKPSPTTSYLPGPVGWQWAKDKSNYILPPRACGMAVGQRQVHLHPTSLGLWDGSGPKTSPTTSYLPGPVGWQWAKDKSNYILPPWACGMAVGQRQVHLHPTSLGLWDGNGPKTSPPTSYLPGPVGWQWAKDKSNYILPPRACGMAVGQSQVQLHPTSLGLWDGSGPKTSPTTSYLPGLWDGSGPKTSPPTSYLPGPVGWQWAEDKSNYILPPWACGMAVGQRQVQLHPTSLGLWDGSGPKTSPPTSYLPGPVVWQWAKDKSNYILPPWACGMAVGQRQVQLHPTSLGLWDGSGPKTSPTTSYLPGPVGWQWAKDKSTYILPPWACGMAMGQRQVQLHPTSLGLWDGSGPKTSPPTSYLPGPVGWQWAKAKSNYILPPRACGMAVGQRQVHLHPTSPGLWGGSGPKTSPTTSYLPGPVGWQWAKDKSNYILPPWTCGMAMGQRQVQLHPTSPGLWGGSGPKTSPTTSYLPGPVGWQWAKDKSNYILPPWTCGVAVGQRQVQLHPTSLDLVNGASSLQ